MARALAILLLLAACAPAASERYMPDAGWSGPDQPDFYEGWFGRQLRAMDEPVLAARKGSGHHVRRFRLLVLPTFRPAYAVRVDTYRRGRSEVRAVRLDGAGGYRPGRVAEDESYRLAGAPLRRLESAIAGAALDTLPRAAEVVPDEEGNIIICGDGVHFVFELTNARGTHLVSRHKCEMTGPLDRLVEAADALRRRVGPALDK